MTPKVEQLDADGLVYRVTLTRGDARTVVFPTVRRLALPTVPEIVAAARGVTK